MTETRFGFGQNWQDFLGHVDAERIDRACHSLVELLGLDPAEEQPLCGKRFLDLGSGSGLFSLAAFRLGADVLSIDLDDDSVACTEALRQKAACGSDRWDIQTGSVLDDELMQSLGQFDIVYSWGVLHHTGQMHHAIRSAAERTAPGGLLAIAIYNDQGGASRRWLAVKRFYHRLPRPLRSLWVVAVASVHETRFALARLVRGRNPLPFADWKAKRLDRGMSAWHDWVDWIGGLPFEVARPETVIVPLQREGFRLINLKTVGGWGCNEYVFRRDREHEEPSPGKAP